MKEELLRFTTAGSVDDGKSTLIGRLLFDSNSIFVDQIESLQKSSERKGLNNIDLSLLTDGLKAEREQGITIDVAYRYFSTSKRKFIIADSPGHIQYTRNMVTGASTANAALILIDARNGVVEQTKRHSYIASLLQIPHLVICVNKMDLVDFKEQKFLQIVESYNDFAAKLDIHDVDFIPISALIGDNVVNRSENMFWYDGDTLLHTLETIPVTNDNNLIDFRFPVQTVIRPNIEKYHDFRGYAGRIAGGVIRENDEIESVSSGLRSKVKAIYGTSGRISESFSPQSITIELEDNIDISRGDMLVKVNNKPMPSQEIDAMLCWMGENEMHVNGTYAIQHTTNSSRCILNDILYKMDLTTMKRIEGENNLIKNDIARIKLKTMSPLFIDSYRKNRNSGSFILIDEYTNNTVAAGMII
ncbi:MAG: sulfate adenylyltransferase subunit 1 [Bacteroidota bacterium]